MEYEQTPLESGWVTHDGSGVPEAIKRNPGARLAIRFRTANVREYRISPEIANMWWDFRGNGGDIIAYRIHQAAAQKPEAARPGGHQQSPVAAAPTFMTESDQRGAARQKATPPAREAGSRRFDSCQRPTRFAGYTVTVSGPAAGDAPQGALQRVADLDNLRRIWGA